MKKIQIPKLRYLGYAALFWAKKATGLRAHRHSNFLIWKLVKKIESGKIEPKKISITSRGKTDGAGAQALAKFSAMCFAQAYGMRYLHVPFSSLAHAEIPQTEWDGAWEGLLQMGAENELLDADRMQIVGIGDYLANPTLWSQKVVISERHFHAFCELAPIHGVEVSKKLQANFLHRNSLKNAHGSLRIAVHVRRGDVSLNDVETRHRYTPNSRIIEILERVVKVSTYAGINTEIHVHTNGNIDEVYDFNRFFAIYHPAGSSAIDTFLSLATSDILICTRSDFSLLAGIYCTGMVICDPRHRTPLPGWIQANGNLLALEKEVTRRLKKGQIHESAHAKS